MVPANMTDKPDPRASKASGVKVSNLGAEAAPFVYFDGAATFGMHQGVVQIELAANILNLDGKGGVRNDVVVTAHLRCSPDAARNLQKEIGNALLIGMPVESRPEGKSN
jgi:hypothetical protein